MALTAALHLVVSMRHCHEEFWNTVAQKVWDGSFINQKYI